MSFFTTKEYIDFKKVHTRVQQPGGNTLKNIDVYINRLCKAIETAQSQFSNIGYYLLEGFRPAYKWAPSPNLSEPNYNNNDIKQYINPEPEMVQTSMFTKEVK